MLGPQLWQEEYKPRNLVPWSLMLGCFIICCGIVIWMGFHLKKLNRIRDQLQPSPPSSSDTNRLNHPHSIDKAFLDLTDLENTGRIYLLSLRSGWNVRLNSSTHPFFFLTLFFCLLLDFRYVYWCLGPQIMVVEELKDSISCLFSLKLAEASVLQCLSFESHSDG